MTVLSKNEVETSTSLPCSRRGFLAGAAAVLAASPLAAETPNAASRPAAFRYCLNTSTISGQKLPIDEEIDLAAKAGYQAIEPWIRELKVWRDAGKSIRELRQRVADRGLTVEDAIGFSDWISDDPQKRAAGLEQWKRELEMLSELGAKRAAAPAAGATKTAITDLRAIADRYRALIDLAAGFGIVPQLELWGASKTLGRIGDIAFIVAEADRPQACALLDIYHLYRGGSPMSGLRCFGRTSLQMFHMNDYPAEPPREQLTDAHRIYPGDGAAPTKEILRSLAAVGFDGFLSLELFNRDYWKQDAAQVAATGLAKMKAAVEQALA